MAQTFTVSKERSTPGTRKHRTPVVVSAQPKTPITVSPPVATTKTTATGAKTTEGKTKKTQVAPKTEIEVASLPAPDVQARKRGRPRKVAAASGTPAAPAPESTVARASSAKNAGAKLKRTRQHRVTGARLLDAERVSGKVPLAARRIVEQLQALLARASVEAFRGKKDRPSVTLSKLEEQAIQEALVLFQLKVSLQRGVEPRQLRVS